ncbi:MAG: hypothetical protein M3Z49_05655, partial [Bifidobacteriales bacterium]|nr:hypothetical protein [Bifidobacteriales bacterium]
SGFWSSQVVALAPEQFLHALFDPCCSHALHALEPIRISAQQAGCKAHGCKDHGCKDHGGWMTPLDHMIGCGLPNGSSWFRMVPRLPGPQTGSGWEAMTA